jgi:hypothetical protein
MPNTTPQVPQAPVTQDNKLQALIEKFGGWTAVALLSLVVYSYQSGQAENQAKFDQINARFTVSEKAINRLSEGKASRAELKELQESFLRETAGLRQDMREGFAVIRSDIAARNGFQK